MGRPGKSPSGRGPGRPPGSKKDKVPQSPIKDYLMTGELRIGEGGVPTKAQLKQPPMHSPTFAAASKSPDKYASKELDFNTNSHDVGVDRDKSVKSSKKDKSKRPPSTPKTDAAERSDVSLDADAVNSQRERENRLRTEILKAEPTVAAKDNDTDANDDASTSGRITPNWIRQQAAEMAKLRAQDENKQEKQHSPAAYDSPVNVDSPKVKVKVKKEKKKEREKRRRDAEYELEKKLLKKERRLEEKLLRERLLQRDNTSQSSASSPDRAPPPPPAVVADEKPDIVQPIRIGLGKNLVIKPVGLAWSSSFASCID